MKLRPLSIREKLLGIVLVSTFTALFVAFLGTVAIQLWTFHRNLIADMSTQSELLGRMTSPALIFDDQRLAAENLKLLEFRSQVRAAAIYNERGNLFASYSAAENSSPFPTLPEADNIRVEGNSLILFKRIIKDGVILGTVYLRVDYDLLGTILNNASLTALLSIMAMVIAFFLISRLERVVTQPIFAIANVAREVVEQRDYSRRAEKMSDDEIGMLVNSFNDMLAEIERRTAALEVSSQEIAREAEERKIAQQEVMRLNAGLEMRVRERTAALERSNRELELATTAAEEANRAKSTFLSSMSHELRTPLNAILGFAEILVTDTMPTTLAQKKDFTNHILKAGRHLLTLINEILDLAKVESGAMTLSLEPVAIAEVMQECRAMIEPMGHQYNIQTIFPDDLGLNVLADRTRLKQVLLNLLSNAVKYNRSSGAVAIEYEPIDAERIRISVRDTGVGLSPIQLEGLFKPFNRLGQEAGAVEGTGIGLVVTKRLVDLMGGEIGVSSTPGIGSVFWIELRSVSPTAAKPDEDILPARAQSPVIQHDDTVQTLLYVEDNPANLKLVEEIIRFRPGLRMLSAPDAHLGIELACIHLPEVILMDINLPGMNGIDALKILRETPETAHIPVIAVTANAMPRDVTAGLHIGFFRYITKPINIEELNKAIDCALEQFRDQDESPA
ncbi:ATP-binding protein [Ferribacterium limneticum]|uniref:ATP-binding protein n=1 Tax=Ferribacterium limneticum TaxID=76259 RepID=UPI001CF8984B|nr:ATP-binding protein [Ferribacterium limneticum]UCV21502.1 response regulator [Ferribacterium limneticum]